MTQESWRQPSPNENAEEAWKAEMDARLRVEEMRTRVEDYLSGPASERSSAKTQLLQNGLDAVLTEFTNTADTFDFTLRDQILALKNRLDAGDQQA
jgi:hypothetical protein